MIFVCLYFVFFQKLDYNNRLLGLLKYSRICRLGASIYHNQRKNEDYLLLIKEIKWNLLNILKYV